MVFVRILGQGPAHRVAVAPGALGPGLSPQQAAAMLAYLWQKLGAQRQLLAQDRNTHLATPLFAYILAPGWDDPLPDGPADATLSYIHPIPGAAAVFLQGQNEPAGVLSPFCADALPTTLGMPQGESAQPALGQYRHFVAHHLIHHYHALHASPAQCQRTARMAWSLGAMMELAAQPCQPAIPPSAAFDCLQEMIARRMRAHDGTERRDDGYDQIVDIFQPFKAGLLLPTPFAQPSLSATPAGRRWMAGLPPHALALGTSLADVLERLSPPAINAVLHALGPLDGHIRVRDMPATHAPSHHDTLLARALLARVDTALQGGPA